MSTDPAAALSAGDAAELADLRRLFDLQWSRTAEATARWRAEDPAGRDLTMPDLGDLLAWLMADADKARAAPSARAGYEQAIATLRGVADRTGSPAASWAADYLTADPDRQAPPPATPATTAGPADVLGEWVKAACGHIWREMRPAGCLIDPDEPRACSQCRADHPASVRPSPQGMAMVPVTYHEHRPA